MRRQTDAIIFYEAISGLPIPYSIRDELDDVVYFYLFTIGCYCPKLFQLPVSTFFKKLVFN